MGKSFIDVNDDVYYTKEQVLKLFGNYNYNIDTIDKNFYKNYVDAMYKGFFQASPPKSYTKRKILEMLLTSCQNEEKYKNIGIIDITK